MEWKLNTLIVLGSITVVASVIGSLETIERFVKRLVTPMRKKRWEREGTWPLEITIKRAELRDTLLPILIVQLLINPRKPTVLGRCEIRCLPSIVESMLIAPTERETFEEWQIGVKLDAPREFGIAFHARADSIGEEVQICVKAEGYDCKSNVVQIK